MPPAFLRRHADAIEARRFIFTLDITFSIDAFSCSADAAIDAAAALRLPPLMPLMLRFCLSRDMPCPLSRFTPLIR